MNKPEELYFCNLEVFAYVGSIIKEDEKHYLLMLIDEYKHTIDNKETDGASLHRKRKAWMKIQESFNSEPNHVERTVTQLQKCWDNIKTKRRKELAASKQAEFCTDERPVKLKDGDKGDPLGCTDFIAMNATDCADSDAVMMSSRSGGTADEDEYQVIEEVVVTLEPDACLPGPREEVSENSLHDLNASGEESFIAAKKRKFETQLKKMTNVSDIENEINAIRKQEAEIRLKIAMEELREAETRTQTTQLQQDFERELLGMKLSYVREVLKGLHRDK